MSATEHATGPHTIDYVGRRARLAEQLDAVGCDAIVIDHPVHVRWLTGFTGSNGAVLVNADGSAMVSTDGRYTTQIGVQAPELELHVSRTCAVELAGRASAAGVGRLGFEAAHVSVAAMRRIGAALDSDGRTELVETADLVEKLRAVKDDAELDALREVAAIAVKAFEDLVASGAIAAGTTERAIAADLEHRMRLGGADGIAFDTIVASGPNSAKPHAGAEDRVLCDGDLITIDFGASKNGYHSDKTRTLVVGGSEAADDFAREIYSTVLRAQLAGIEAARPGTPLADVDRACREVIVAAGHGEYFVHSTGHGIGLDVHEAPFASSRSQETLATGMTLTIEPGIYVPGFGGVRIEDTVIVTDGEPEIITPLPKTV
ncbi:M24 family metallopeptidase [Corynebacterium hansenii]|uniref:M24 family metallopeptidase n=1 Tax=Corynebacterium hansenii TaxID=394964 RepID=A0ABV7ZUH9_9CORY|nr:Xaa-Pro peptidase family protein [Corynebacterium hansenii]WJY99928.1 putative peptidase [Corynebacterium hansenii]